MIMKKVLNNLSNRILSPTQEEIDLIFLNYNSGKLNDAKISALSMTRNYPKFQFGWKVLGAIYKTTGHFMDALTCMEMAVQIDVGDAEAHNNLGATLQDLGRQIQAERSYRQAIQLRPEYAEAYLNLGITLTDLGRLTEAESSYRQAILLKPEYAVAHFNLGNVLKDLGSLIQAERSYRQAIQLRPEYAEAYLNLGITLADLGRLTEAESSYRQAILLKPNFAEAHNNLGNVLKDLGSLIQAECSYRQAIQLRPEYAEAHNNLGNIFVDLGNLIEAESSYRQAIILKPGYAEAYSNLLLALNFVEPLKTTATLEEARCYGSVISSRAIPKFINWSNGTNLSKLRIGFVSGNLNNHPVGFFIEGLIKNLDKDQFEIIAFPTVLKSDDLTARIKPYFQEWIPIFGKGDLEAAKIIYEKKIHVLIDLSGHTGSNRLPVFSFKPAPVQVSWLGYFASTGLPEIDYILGDPYVTPQTEDFHFCEKIHRLPESYLCFTPPDIKIDVNRLPALQNQFITFGCFNRISKMDLQVVNTWAIILTRIPNSKLLLKTKHLDNPLLATEVYRKFATHGITLDRLLLEGPSPRDGLLAAYNRVDIALDPFPYPGGTTSVEALWMGVPVLTLKGNRFLSHVGETIAYNVGHSEWISKDLDDYVAKAIYFSNDLNYLSNIREKLRNNVLQSPLFDVQRFADNFGKGIGRIWNQYLKDIKQS